MKIPKKVKIGAHTLDIVVRDMIDDHGKCDTDKLILYLDNESTAPEVMKESFFHEALHAIRIFAGIADKDEDEEEKQVQPMAHMLYAFLKENNLLK